MCEMCRPFKEVAKFRETICEFAAQFNNYRNYPLEDKPCGQRMSDHLLELGMDMVRFSYPVVPKGQARIHVQLSVARQRADLDAALQP
jgi:7-keto-8-aminopelargonate synthetase-like enzyme|tara:strand:+ start:3093 stop:3356 length:264 start_codon:yes stop_codon:yes gene_type:complete